MSGSSKRRDYLLLGHPVRRVCMEHLLGISSHRTDRIGCIDMRFRQHPTKPSELTASIDAFCCVMYNSIAEPLPDKLAWLYVGIFSFGNFSLWLKLFKSLSKHIHSMCHNKGSFDRGPRKPQNIDAKMMALIRITGALVELCISVNLKTMMLTYFSIWNPILTSSSLWQALLPLQTLLHLIWSFWFAYFCPGSPQLASSVYWTMCSSHKFFIFEHLWNPKMWGYFATGEEIFAPRHNFWDVPVLRGMVWCTSDWTQSFATWACLILEPFSRNLSCLRNTTNQRVLGDDLRGFNQ